MPSPAAVRKECSVAAEYGRGVEICRRCVVRTDGLPALEVIVNDKGGGGVVCSCYLGCDGEHNSSVNILLHHATVFKTARRANT